MKFAQLFFVIGVVGISCCGKNNGIPSEIEKHTASRKYLGPCRMYSIRNENDKAQQSNQRLLSIKAELAKCSNDEFDTRIEYDSDGKITKKTQKINDTIIRSNFIYDSSRYLIKETKRTTNSKYSTTETKTIVNDKGGKPLSAKIVNKTDRGSDMHEIRFSYPKPDTTISLIDISGREIKITTVEQKDRKGKLLIEKRSHENGLLGDSFKKYFYDKKGNLESVEEHYSGSDIPVKKYKYTTDDFGNILLTTVLIGGNQCPIRIVHDYSCWRN